MLLRSLFSENYEFYVACFYHFARLKLSTSIALDLLNLRYAQARAGEVFRIAFASLRLY